MKQEHSHESGHHHHVPEIKSLNAIFIFGITLNLVFVIVEFLAGYFSDSVGLISDAGHNLSDVASLVLAMMAYRLAKVKANKHYTYGFKKGTVLVSLTNAVLLLIAIGFIIKESIEKFIHPQPVEGGVIIWVAAIGVVINALTAWLFIKDKEKDLNIKGAYLHMAADTLVSVGVVISGIVIVFTGWYIIDPIIGLLIAVIIVISTWKLLSDSLRLAIDGVPENIHVTEISDLILAIPGVEGAHHIHVWAISTTENALTAHIVIQNIDKMESIKHLLKCELAQKGIQHATLEFEVPGCDCQESGGIKDCGCSE